jgi:Protein of unknown function (DUF1015)
MVRVHAFEALRPAGSRAALVSCPAHVGPAHASGAEQKGAGTCGCCTESHSYRQVLDAASAEDARRVVQRLQAEGILSPDPEPCMYVYRITRDGRRQVGVVAAVDRDTLESRNGLGATAQATPTWGEPATAVFDDSSSTIAELAASDMNERPLFHFNAGDGTTHSGWLAHDPQRYTAAFAALPGRARLVRPGACAGCDRILTLLLDATGALDPLPIPRCGLFVPCTALVS